ncbi:MAG: hypothetical protein NTX55_01700, partial [Candidatus Parcubacteria bacterium]|nr:hypothetical protein [Candidatus Parcubacteria bacterium]
DEAGKGAAGRGIDSALAEGFEVKVAVIPSGKDPADAIRENPKEWEEALAHSKNIIEFHLNSAKNRKEIEKIVLPYVAILPGEMEKAHWVNEIAKHLRIKEEAVWLDLKKIKFSRSDLAEERSDLREPQSRLRLLEDRIIGLILWQKNCGDEELKKVMDEITGKEKFDLNKPEILENAERIIFEAELFYGGTESLKNEFEKLISEFKKEKIKSELLAITEEIRECETVADKKDELEKYLNKFYELGKNLSELK